MESVSFADGHVLERVEEGQRGITRPRRTATRVCGRRHVGGRAVGGDSMRSTRDGMDCDDSKRAATYHVSAICRMQ